jgi:hypothetical protein
MSWTDVNSLLVKFKSEASQWFTFNFSFAQKNKQANKQVIKVKAAIDIHVTLVIGFLAKYF